jgi:MMPL family protein
MLSLIALVTLALLARAFRSLVLAVKAVIFNLASLGVAYGVMVLVWQQGHGSHALWSIPATGAITVYVALLAFAFLFGLSMDYEVLILSRVREEYDATGSTNQAVIRGIGRTGRLVTSAALILFLAFRPLRHPRHRRQDARHRPGRGNPPRRRHHPLAAAACPHGGPRPAELVAFRSSSEDPAGRTLCPHSKEDSC